MDKKLGDPIAANERLRIAHCQTEVDETGQSYYGGSRLAFMRLGANGHNPRSRWDWC